MNGQLYLAAFLESEKLKNRLIEDQRVAITYFAELLDHFAPLCYNMIITVIGEAVNTALPAV